jgi:hypothetical protein
MITNPKIEHNRLTLILTPTLTLTLTLTYGRACIGKSDDQHLDLNPIPYPTLTLSLFWTLILAAILNPNPNTRYVWQCGKLE